MSYDMVINGKFVDHNFTESFLKLQSLMGLGGLFKRNLPRSQRQRNRQIKRIQKATAGAGSME